MRRQRGCRPTTVVEERLNSSSATSCLNDELLNGEVTTASPKPRSSSGLATPLQHQAHHSPLGSPPAPEVVRGGAARAASPPPPRWRHPVSSQDRKATHETGSQDPDDSLPITISASAVSTSRGRTLAQSGGGNGGQVRVPLSRAHRSVGANAQVVARSAFFALSRACGRYAHPREPKRRHAVQHARINARRQGRAPCRARPLGEREPRRIGPPLRRPRSSRRGPSPGRRLWSRRGASAVSPRDKKRRPPPRHGSELWGANAALDPRPSTACART